MDKPKLWLESLHERHTGLTASQSGTYYEAATVCLSRHHDSPMEIDIIFSNATSTRLVEFQKPNSHIEGAYANKIDATEEGAYGVCLAAVEATAKLVAVRRAETLTGADWYVAPIGAEPQDLENCFRLEVSGVDAGNKSVVDGRLRQKVEQTKRGASNLPAIATVVGFKERMVAIKKVEEDAE